jgi:hypothetical protein
MNNTLGDTLTIEMCQQINQVKVLEEKRAIGADSLESLGILNRAAIGRSIDWLLRILKGRRGFIVGNHDCG